MKSALKKMICLSLCLLIGSVSVCVTGAEETKEDIHPLSIEEFIRLAVKNDTVFEEILIDELALQYRKDLKLPARDLVLSVKSQYDFILSGGREDPEMTVSLSRLFPYTGTNISAGYGITPSLTSDKNNSEFTVLISQPIAENAFGRSTRLQDKIIGMEIDVTDYQIIEAYEDYLATVITAYYNWYSAYENMKIGESSYQQNLKLLDNIKERQKSSIALPIDVNKIDIQVLGKKEDLITLEERYENVLNFIKQTIRYKGGEALEPVDPMMYDHSEIAFKDDYEKFTQASRTYRILNLLEEKSSLEVKKDADDLLPSTNLLLGYRTEGDEWKVKHNDNLVFAGISIDWPFPDQVERAEYETSKITHHKTQLSSRNKYVQLYTDLRNIFIQIEREKKLIAIADEKIALAEAILKDETKNYSYGKVTLNDFIDAVNRVDDNKFNKILHSVQLKVLVTEWLRLTDQLINKKEVQEKHPGQFKD